MESGRAVRPIFTSIITALQQRLMLYDSRAVPPTALEGCGSRWATGIMASVNLRCRTFTLKGPHVRWRGRINTVCAPLTPTPPTAPSPAVPTSQRPLAVTLPHFPMSLLISWVLNNHIGGEDGGDIQKGWQANGTFHLLSLKPGRQHLLTCHPLGGDVLSEQRIRGQVCVVVTLPVSTLFKSLFSAGVQRAIFESYPWTHCSENQVILFNPPSNWGLKSFLTFNQNLFLFFFSSKHKWQKEVWWCTNTAVFLKVCRFTRLYECCSLHCHVKSHQTRYALWTLWQHMTHYSSLIFKQTNYLFIDCVSTL